MFVGARWDLERHRAVWDGQSKLRARREGIVGVSAARLGRWGDARTYLFRSLSHDPRDRQRWMRMMAALVQPIGRRVWDVDDDWTRKGDPSPLAKVAVTAPPSPDSLFLPWRYQENPPDASHGEVPCGSDPAYRFAARLVRKTGGTPVLDVGCGSGRALVARIGAVTDAFVGVDQPSAIGPARREFPERRWIEGDLMGDAVWEELRDLGPRVIICAGVLERVADPRFLLDRIREITTPETRLLLSTPDRDRLEGASALGPPLDRGHIREWSMNGLCLLLEAAGFATETTRHLLPREYSVAPTDLKRVVWRALHGKAIPDRRSTSLVVARRSRSSLA
jgi:SAM-dependent methyltransferase